MATQTGLSIEEFLAGEWPPTTQLIDGEAVMHDPTFGHNEIVLRLAWALRDWMRATSTTGRVGTGGNWTVAAGQVFKPDVWWAAEGAVPDLDAVRSDSPPTLAVEVRSPGTWRYDVGRKRQVYEQVGVAELWLVDTPARSVVVHRRSAPGVAVFDITDEAGPGEVLTTPLLAGFTLAVDTLFTS
jgi:Uma2 family endonuclease